MESSHRLTLRQIGERLLEAGSIVIASHTRPDGDAIGSVIALADTLEGLGKQVVALNADGVPGKYRFLPGSERIQTPGDALQPDLMVALDTGDRSRIGQAVWDVVPEGTPVIVMDHHVSNERYGDLNYIDTGSPATGQIIYQLLETMGWPVSDQSRDGIWAAMVTDTGSFQYPATTPETLRIAASLLEAGLDLSGMTRCLFQAFPFRRVELLSELLNALERSEDGRVAWWKLTRSTCDRLQIQPDDAEGLIDHLRAIEGVIVAVSFEEAGDGTTRVSARSKDAEVVDVSRVCGQFGGGGHRLAAGARIDAPLDTAASTFLSAITKELRNGND